MRARSAAALLAVLIAATTACEAGTGTGGAAAERDSAGIAVVESGAPAWASGGGWEIAPEPRFTTGLPADTVPASGRIWAATFLRGDRIVLADALARRIHVLDRRGAPIVSLAGRGEAAGQLASLVRVFAYRGDSIAAYDLSRAAIEIFHVSGAHGRTVQLGAGRAGSPPAGVLADGRFLITIGAGRRRATERDTIRLFLLSPDGARAEQVAALPPVAAATGAAHTDLAGATGAGPALVAAGGDVVVWARPDRRELHRIVAGRPAALIRWRPDAEPGGDPPAGEAGARPVIGRIRMAPGDQVWVLRADTRARADTASPAPAPGEPETWDVFDRDGRWLGPMRLPPGASLLDVGADGVLVTAPGAGETDSIAFHEIRPATAPIR